MTELITTEILTDIILGVIGVVITVCVPVLTKKFVSMLKDKKLYDIVKRAVMAFEKEYEDTEKSGAVKYDALCEYLKKKGIKIESEDLDVLVDSILLGIDKGLE